MGHTTSLNDEPLDSFSAASAYGQSWALAVKRLIDVSCCLPALLLLAPLLAAIALLIKITSPGPVIFRQERVGFRNKRFLLFKFRTMRHEQNPDPLVPQAIRDDDRITRVGAVLRRSSLDELPQLLNVLRGDMSLVGPRPHAVAHDDLYSRLIDGYLSRHDMKPGLTGLAQVNGERGRTETAQMMHRVRLDLRYIANWSLGFDLKITLMTVPAIIRGHNAF